MQLVKSAGKKGERSRQTRRRILQAAYELFVDQGYGATTLQGVAERAGVSVQTIYFAFGNKPSLLKELVDVTIAGDDEPVPTLQRAWFLDAVAADTAEAQLRAHVRGTCEVLQRVAPIMDVLRAAGGQDPSLAGLWQQDSDPRLEVQTAAARSLLAKPGARARLSVEDAADVLFGLLSPELYLLFVRDRGWTPERWQQWAHDTLRAQLCD
ncbi:TetR/AcrR family transcriptional regulator [Micromonospora sp. DT46]|uniref:TetR/AcrR family transcriptional regulator n=1 Tax=unclassified Micromonospora TaxID=2617518 RepID=UPI00124B3011|nr:MULTISPECIES: TetR/AcrR family transcriptional regulator [unclassified Micromonospora]KAB1153686.1 TetR/AcrR family transcriptional regulator [Micromonospora sp. AMSO12t]WSG04885.1 TetR/AcrR family transcriptional regulator [Micromonospora sp. NBC_01740]